MSMIPEKKLNIAMLGHKTIPSRQGGVEVVVEELSARMAQLGHNIVCYNRRIKGIDTIKKHKGVIIKSAATINARGLAAATSSFFASIKAAFGRYDIVHIHAEGPAFMCWLPKLFGKKVIVTVHGLDHQRAKWGRFASRYILKGEKNAVRYADEIIVLSENLRNYFNEHYGRTTSFIPNGQNLPNIRSAEIITEKWGLNKDSYILFLGRIVPEKGIQYLIKAFENVITDKKLVIAGGSSDTDEFMTQVLKLAENNDRIVFTGHVEGQSFEELMSNCLVYVLPSDLEGMPLSLLEAISYGNCCVVSDISECTEIIGNSGVVFSKGSTDELQEKLQELCDNIDLVKAFRSRAGVLSRQQKDWDQVTEDTLSLYQRVIG